MNDPLVAALTAAVEEALARGLVVTPVGDGWLVQLAPPQQWAVGIDTEAPDTQVRRTW